ncbi:uncharacterized protein PHACADRAFT_33491 [Phanerochaete carnosa HHB-10118-sp]|uniref:HMG box domain-containing protein n=1 Tax=Phanerochaete carnosa (strain HHB-10118-sp) TaxID=650164 RepID=K5VSA8_PHACS|nr:uncharacterized protein PHACADRAFT_33491 [Phanerochaete carnosa HHB-10118-sp]EKM49449.1 hypothetical protein PHACADRAFT_33491 [Phanerochaete carnosa HHB-10118-sp]
MEQYLRKSLKSTLASWYQNTQQSQPNHNLAYTPPTRGKDRQCSDIHSHLSSPLRGPGYNVNKIFASSQLRKPHCRRTTVGMPLYTRVPDGLRQRAAWASVCCRVTDSTAPAAERRDYHRGLLARMAFWPSSIITCRRHPRSSDGSGGCPSKHSTLAELQFTRHGCIRTSGGGVNNEPQSCPSSCAAEQVQLQLSSSNPPSGLPHTSMASFHRDSPSESSLASPTDSKYRISRSSRPSLRSSSTLSQAKHQNYHIPRPAEFLFPVDYQVPQPQPRIVGSRVHILRPINTFLLFRSFLSHNKLRRFDQRNEQRATSITAGYTWSSLPNYVRQQWTLKAKEAADLHQMLFPNYRLQLSSRISAGNSAAELATVDQTMNTLGITDVSPNDSSDSLTIPDLTQPHHAGNISMESTTSLWTLTPSLPTLLDSASFLSVPPVVGLQYELFFHQLITQLESDNIQLKQRLTQIQDSSTAGQTSASHAPQQLLTAGVEIANNRMFSDATLDSSLSLAGCGPNQFDDLLGVHGFHWPGSASTTQVNSSSRVDHTLGIPENQDSELLLELLGEDLHTFNDSAGSPFSTWSEGVESPVIYSDRVEGF